MDREGRRASTVASAIETNRPVNLVKCLRALEATDGVVREVSDEEILEAKAWIGRGGFGCEPASAVAVAGTRALRNDGTIGPDDTVACVLTGHGLKDPTTTVEYHSNPSCDGEGLANPPVPVANDVEAILRLIE